MMHSRLHWTMLVGLEVLIAQLFSQQEAATTPIRFRLMPHMPSTATIKGIQCQLVVILEELPCLSMSIQVRLIIVC